MIFIVIGPTGAGKTNFINALAGTPGDGGAAYLNAGTRRITSHVVERDGRRLVFVDTPGLDNTHLTDAGIFMLVAKWLETKYQSNIDLGIIYLHRITDNRIQGSPHKHIEMLRKQCSSVAVRQICLVTTMWDDVDDTAEAEMREKFLKEELQRKNVRETFKRFNNQRSSAWNTISELIRDHPAITTASTSSNDKLNDMVFVVMGPTGSGKTNFINALTGTSDDSTAGNLTAGTRSVTPCTLEHDGRRLVFLDTPGLDSTYLPDAVILMLVARWLEKNHGSNIALGIIYLHRITDNRIQGSSHKHLEMFRKQYSGVAVRQICLVTTMWDDVDNTAEAEMREEFLKEEFQRKNVRETFKRFNNQRSSAWEIMSELIRDYPAITMTSNHHNLDNMIFLVMGPTGSGKTNFINTLVGTSGDGVSASLNAGTRSVTPHAIGRDGRDLVFVDTPGLDNTHLTDAGIFMLVAKWVETNYRSITELRIIYLHRITDNRIQGSPHKHIEMLRKLCSSVTVRQICLVTTMWDDVDDTAEAEKRESFLKEEFQKENIRALFKRFDNQRSSAWDIASELMGGEARLLQEELEDRERRSNEPGAWGASYIQLQQLLSRRRDVLQHLVAQAATEGNVAHVHDLQVEHDILDAQIRITFEEMRARNTSLIRRVLQWLAQKLGTTYD